jgi:hypothetical protein
MLYPIATVSYPLTLSIGLPYGAPFQGPMAFYQGLNQYVQLTFTIPYSVPNGYSIRVRLVAATIIQGTAYVNFQSLNYTTIYKYGSDYVVMSSMGSITIGTVVSINFEINIASSSLFEVHTYIDTDSVISAFVSSVGSNYVYYGLIEGSGIPSTSSFFSAVQDTLVTYN